MQISATQSYQVNVFSPPRVSQGGSGASVRQGALALQPPAVTALGEGEANRSASEGGRGVSPQDVPTSRREVETPDELRQLQALKSRDQEVRAHEAAHLAAGASIARGGMTFTFQRGPDGVLYAVGGEVSIDTGREPTPEATLQKAEIIRRAALAPAEPSPQDRSIAARATQMAAQARIEIAQQVAAGAEQDPLSMRRTTALASYHQGQRDDVAMPGVDEMA